MPPSGTSTIQVGNRSTVDGPSVVEMFPTWIVEVPEGGIDAH